MAYLPFVTAVVSAWIVAATRKDHRPIALLLTFGLAIDLVRFSIGHPTTFTSFLISESLYLLWSAAVVDTLLHASFRLFRGALAIPWLTVVGVVALLYPVDSLALEGLHRFLHLMAGGAFVASLFAFSRRKVTSMVVALWVVSATELLLVLGPYALSHAAKSWEVACAIYGTAFVILTFLHVGILCSPRILRWTRSFSPTPNS